jgi:putative phosphoribosyl transferase
MLFHDRQDAGQKLAKALKKFKNTKDTIILALPRGGVVIGFEIAKELNLPMDIVVPRKIGAPDNPEFAIGAITESGEGIFSSDVISTYGISQNYIDKTVAHEKKEAERRLQTYRGNRPPLELKDKTVIIVDDGIATGSTMKAAIKSVKIKNAKKVIVAVPTSASDSAEEIKKEVAKFICLDIPKFFGAVGAFYEVFAQTEDEEVIELLKKSDNFGK